MKLTNGARRLARSQNGLITCEQWIATGGNRRSFYRAVEVGMLGRVAPGVAALVGTTIGPLHRIHAEVLSSATDVMASHRSAAFLWGAPLVGDDPVDLISPTPTRRRHRPGVHMHRPLDHVDLRPARRQRVAVTGVVRTLLDLGAVRPRAVLPALEAFLVADLIRLDRLRAATERHRVQGRAGPLALLAAMDDAGLHEAPPDSVLEADVARLFDDHGVTGWVFHARIAGFEVDFAFPDHRVVVEIDGFAYHSSRRCFESDRDRDSRLATLGWIVLRFTWLQVRRSPSDVARRVLATLTARA